MAERGFFRSVLRRMQSVKIPRAARQGAAFAGVGGVAALAGYFLARLINAHPPAQDLLPDRQARDHEVGDPPPLEQGAALTPEHYEAQEPGRGRLARTPLEIPLKGWIDIFWRLVHNFNGDRVPFVAGGVTFFTILAIFPALGVFVSLYGLFADASTAREHLGWLYGVVPQGVLAFVGDQMERIAGRSQQSLGLAFAGSLLLSLWSANASVKTLIYGLNIAYHETEKRNFFRYTLWTLSMTFGGLTFVLFTTGIVVGTPALLGLFGRSLDLEVLRVVRWPALFVGYVTMLSLLYRYGPCRQTARWRWLTVGGLVAAVLSMGVSALFSWYLSNVADYDATYGSLGTLMGFMVWTWWSVIVVLIGAELNAEMEHQTVHDTTTGAARPMGLRGALVADTIGPRRGAPGFIQYTVDGALELSRRFLVRRGRDPDIGAPKETEPLDPKRNRRG